VATIDCQEPVEIGEVVVIKAMSNNPVEVVARKVTSSVSPMAKSNTLLAVSATSSSLAIILLPVTSSGFIQASKVMELTSSDALSLSIITSLSAGTKSAPSPIFPVMLLNKLVELSLLFPVESITCESVTSGK